MAAWDLIGRRLQQPLCNLCGGYFRRRVPVAIKLSGRNAHQVACVAREHAEQGFHTQTLLASGRPDEDLATLAAVREMVGGRVVLRFDGLSRYAADAARELCTAAEFEELEFVIDPLEASDLFGMAALCRQTNVPLAARNLVHGPADILAAARCGAATYALVDLDQVGGIAPARACAAVAQAAGVNPVLVQRPSVGVAAAAALHLATAGAAFSCSQEIVPRQLRDSVLRERLRIVDGMMVAPQGPGLGVEIDRAKVEKYQVA